MTDTEKIAVLVSWHADAVSGRPVRNQGDAVALALALRLAGPDAVRVVSAGAMPEEAARDYLAQGARSVELLVPPQPASNLTAVGTALARAVRDCELVFTGMRSEGGLGSGLLPYELGARLQRPVVADVVELREEGGSWLLAQALPRGARRRLRVNVPVVLAVHPSAPVALRYAHKSLLAGQVLRQPVSMSEGGSSPWQFVPAARRLQCLRAERAQSGHSRMLGAIAADQGAAAGTVLKDGSAEAKARAVFEYLKQHALLNV